MAIRSRIRKDLSRETILERTSEYDIFSYYIGNFTPGNVISSPFRKDENPSFFIGNRYGFLHYHDLANPSVTGDCFKFVQELFKINYHEALKRIDEDLNLGITKGINRRLNLKPIIVVPKKEYVPTDIRVVSRNFNVRELKYWDKFYLGLEDLKWGEVYAIKSLFIHKKKYQLKHQLVFAYHLDGFFKIYFPEADKAKGEIKWLSNMKIDHMEGLLNIKKAKTSLILKSRKERMIINKFFTASCASTQNESEKAINPKNINYLQENSENTFLCFDNDDTGVRACTYYNQFGFNYWNISKEYLPIKDLAEFIEEKGPENMVKELSKKIKL